ncbi:MAG TPA: SDR family oxidoreductase [Candidatus Tectomicrobia bacterium]|nr:SDR family oxidoreductase [Candidatus Tectomicrobia bacterium]
MIADPLAAFRLDGDVAVVTGGASGIGRAVAQAFAAVGATVAIFDLAGGDGIYQVDVADEAQVTQALADVVARHGRVDVLFNNAGIAIRQPTTDLTLEAWNRVVAVNMTGVFLCAREAARHMLASGRGGRIVNTASIMGFSGGGLYPNVSYQATKGAVVNMTRSLAVEWARRGIRVNAIAPTWVRTPLIRNITERPELVRRIEEMTPMGRLAEVDEIVGGVLYLASRASAMVTGHTLAIDGGFLAQ